MAMPPASLCDTEKTAVKLTSPGVKLTQPCLSTPPLLSSSGGPLTHLVVQGWP